MRLRFLLASPVPEEDEDRRIARVDDVRVGRDEQRLDAPDRLAHLQHPTPDFTQSNRKNQSRTWSTSQVLHVLKSPLLACSAPEIRVIYFFNCPASDGQDQQRLEAPDRLAHLHGLRAEGGGSRAEGWGLIDES